MRKQGRKGGREEGRKGGREEGRKGGRKGGKAGGRKEGGRKEKEKGREKEKGKQKIGRLSSQQRACKLQAVMHSSLAGFSHEAMPAEVTALLTVASRNPRNTLIASLVIL